MKNTVYVIMDSHGKNLLPAKEFGDLRVMLKGDESPTEATNKLERALSEMSHDDHLLLIGNPVFIALASHIALTKLDGEVKLLVWDRESYSYNSTTIRYDTTR